MLRLGLGPYLLQDTAKPPEKAALPPQLRASALAVAILIVHFATFNVKLLAGCGELVDFLHQIRYKVSL
jgi:hypothetical protein